MDLREDIQTMFRGDQRLPDKHTTPTCQILDSGTQTLSSTSHCMPENLLEVPSPSTGVVWENSSVASDPSPQHSHEGARLTKVVGNAKPMGHMARDWNGNWKCSAGLPWLIERLPNHHHDIPGIDRRASSRGRGIRQ